MNVPLKSLTWNLTTLLAKDDDPKILQKRQRIKQQNFKFINRWKSRTDYLKQPKILKQALDEYENLMHFWGQDGDEGYYFHLKTALDLQNPELKAHLNQITDFASKLENDLEFFSLNIAKIPLRNQAKFLAYPELDPYKHFLEQLFKKSSYLLSEPEEKILNLKAKVSHTNWVRMVSGFLASEEGKVIIKPGKAAQNKNFSEILSLLNDKNKTVRDSGARAFNKILQKYVRVAEEEINSILQNKKIDDELRNIPRPDLIRHLSDDIRSETVDTLIETVSSRFDIPARYYKLKAKLLGVKKLAYHERNLEYGNLNQTYSFEKSVDLVSQVFQSLDPEFDQIFKRLITNGQVDVYPKAGKTTGAFCTGHLLSQPTFVLLNHTNKLTNAITLAHEFGHAINNELIKKQQNALNFATPLSTAEVASTFMEDFVFQEISQQADDKTKLSLLMMKLNDDVSSIFRQIACYKFETELHQQFRDKGYLDYQTIGKIFQQHMASYMGKFVQQDKGSENWWIYWHHIRSFFYVYSYASGLLISKSLQNQLKQNPKFINQIKRFLSAGTSDSPENIFQNLGIDINRKTFWQNGLTEIDNTLKLAEELANRV